LHPQRSAVTPLVRGCTGDPPEIMTDTLVEAPPLRLERDRPGFEAWRTFLGAHAAIMRRLEADLDAEGPVSLADFDVLIQLATAPGGKLRMSELADQVLLSRSGMTRRIDRLETAGLVRRTECSLDRRGSYATITPAGLERLQDAEPTHVRGIHEHFVSKLTARDLATIEAALGKLLPPEPTRDPSSC
jgi:DNA-binding MarR family transcriptional regulator